MAKGTPKEWVDKLLAVGPKDWVPPIPRYFGPRPDEAEHPDCLLDWPAEWRRLARHHELETDVLNAVIRELVRRVKSD